MSPAISTKEVDDGPIQVDYASNGHVDKSITSSILRDRQDLQASTQKLLWKLDTR